MQTIRLNEVKASMCFKVIVGVVCYVWGGGGRFELGTNQKEEGWVINNLEREGRWGRDGHFTLHVLMNKLEG